MKSLISLFASAREQEPEQAINIATFLQQIKSGMWQAQVETLRKHIASGDRVKYDQRKRELPAVTVSCHCLSRERDLSPEAKSVTHSGWLQADFDLKDNPILSTPESVTAIRAALLADPYVGAVFVGPSGEGMKAVIKVNPERHKDSWFAAEAHFKAAHGLNLDQATKDNMRLCFVSYDPELEISPDFDDIPLPEATKQEEKPWYPPLETTGTDIEEMLSFIPTRPDYETWVRIASAVWSVLPAVEGAQLLNKWSPEEKEGEYLLKHRSRLKQVTVGTLAHIASLHGFDARAAGRRRRWAGRIRFNDGVRGPGAEEDPTVDPMPVAAVELTHARIMEAFASGQAGDARLWCQARKGLRVYNTHAKMWMIYEDGIWRRDTGMTTIWDMTDMLCSVYRTMADAVELEMRTNPAPDPKKDPRKKEADGFKSRIASLKTWNYISAVEKFAIRDLNSPATAFDCSPGILVVKNGVIDFAEDIFREHRPSDMATMRSPVNFDPDAKCPHWDWFCNKFLPSQELIEYIARDFGYSLTGYVQHDVAFFTHGKGANGKSTLYGVLKLLLGEQMTTVPIAALLATKADSNFDYHKASMEGKRVVLTDEIPEGRTLADSQIKAITGGDPINARRPYELPYNFLPTHKLWLMGNHKPDIKGTDHGIWRRIHLIPFDVTISDAEKRDRHTVMAEFEAEISGILNWAIKGYLDSRDKGLQPPEQVLAATAEYREESDQFGAFLAECTENALDGRLGMSTLGKTYGIWCERNNENPRYQGTRKLKEAMKSRGFSVLPDRSNHPTAQGVRLRRDEANNVVDMECDRSGERDLPGMEDVGE